jgi:hypothetical protein
VNSGFRVPERARGTRGILRGCNTFDDNAFGFKVGDTVVGAVTHHDRPFEESNERARGFGEPAVVGLVPVDGESVDGVALGAGERFFEDTGEGVDPKLADWFGARPDSGDSQVHFLDSLSPVRWMMTFSS